MTITNIENIIESNLENIVKKIVDEVSAENWTINIDKEIEEIIEKKEFDITVSTVIAEDNDTGIRISLDGLVAISSDYCFLAEVKHIQIDDNICDEIEYEEGNVVISYIPTMKEINSVLQSLLEFSPAFSRFCSRYRQVKNNNDYTSLDYSILFDNNLSWELSVDSTKTGMEFVYCSVLRNGLKYLGFVYYNNKQALLSSIFTDECNVTYHIPNEIPILDGNNTIKEYVLRKMSNLSTDKQYNDFEWPHWFIDERIKYIESSTFESNNTHNIGIKDIIIRTTNYFCISKNHKLESITAILLVNKNGKISEVEAEALYCKDCDEYYMSEYEFTRIRKMGLLCHKVITEKEYSSGNFKTGNWAEKSVLASYGYSANEKDGLTDSERQDIIAFVIDYDIMNPNEVISFLEWLIKNRGKTCPKACDKWNTDVSYVRNYINNNQSVKVNKIYKKEYI